MIQKYQIYIFGATKFNQTWPVQNDAADAALPVPFLERKRELASRLPVQRP
jgi:hypothetical protein